MRAIETRAACALTVSLYSSLYWSSLTFSSFNKVGCGPPTQKEIYFNFLFFPLNFFTCYKGLHMKPESKNSYRRWSQFTPKRERTITNMSDLKLNQHLPLVLAESALVGPDRLMVGRMTNVGSTAGLCLGTAWQTGQKRCCRGPTTIQQCLQTGGQL